MRIPFYYTAHQFFMKLTIWLAVNLHLLANVRSALLFGVCAQPPLSSTLLHNDTGRGAGGGGGGGVGGVGWPETLHHDPEDTRVLSHGTGPPQNEFFSNMHFSDRRVANRAMWTRCFIMSCGRANMAHVRQPRPDSGLSFKIKALDCSLFARQR
jgi:hypothetical protein